MKEIQSTQHPLVKHFVKLREKKEYRSQCQTATVSGIKLIKELACVHRFKTVLLEKNSYGGFPVNADQLFMVSSEILKKVTGLVHPEPIAAEIALPQLQPCSPVDRILILDGISDPGNMGTLLRTAAALGWQAAWITPKSTDPFNDKALRAAKGATFKLPLTCASEEEILTFLSTAKHTLFAADMQGTPLEEIPASGPIALVLGSESHGVSEWIKKSARSIAIPMDHVMESLNVASAGAILMHHFKKSL
jgi:TrmH family RNA methyltransferase